MDPIMLIEQAIHDTVTTRESCRNYAQWLLKGGFHVRVQLHPCTDAWMMGDRFGVVVSVSRKFAMVKCDRSGKLRKVAWINLMEVVK